MPLRSFICPEYLSFMKSATVNSGLNAPLECVSTPTGLSSTTTSSFSKIIGISIGSIVDSGISTLILSSFLILFVNFRAEIL